MSKKMSILKNFQKVEEISANPLAGLLHHLEVRVSIFFKKLNNNLDRMKLGLSGFLDTSSKANRSKSNK